jgi:hypothetical protein
MMRRLISLGAVVVVLGIVTPARAWEAGQTEPPCYWCVRDAIYDDASLIAHREANPDVDEAVKGPEITAARADIHRLRATLGPVVQTGPEPCCYARPPLHIR